MSLKYACMIAISLFLAAPGTVRAQVAEVPDAESNGDFNTAIVQGNRGFYTNDRWVVVAKSREDYLNCRESPNGEVHSLILPGAVITAAFGCPGYLNNGLAANYANDAIVTHNGSPWLRVMAQDVPLVFPVGQRDSTSPGECHVRASLQYITPVNNEAEAVFQ